MVSKFSRVCSQLQGEIKVCFSRLLVAVVPPLSMNLTLGLYLGEFDFGVVSR